jgi:2-polyprenyl-6-methoxyphenol hydroxylase-like FAD-dependent oxidoreductase
MRADWVVDASGRTSHAPKWLQAIGCPAPRETEVNSFLGYASRWYQRPDPSATDWKALLVWPKPPHSPRAGLLYPTEGDRWVLTLTAPGRDYPPTDETGFLTFARSLRTPALYEAVKEAEPLSPIYSYRRTENRWRHFEHLTAYPEGFVVLGDAVCAFNPIYAQGMTTAALGALTLQQCFQEAIQQESKIAFAGNLAHYYQQRLARVSTSPWLMATGEDFRWKTTEGGHPGIQHQFLHWYVDRLRTLTLRHPEILQVFLEVLHMVKPITALFQPHIAMKVFTGV